MRDFFLNPETLRYGQVRTKGDATFRLQLHIALAVKPTPRVDALLCAADFLNALTWTAAQLGLELLQAAAGESWVQLLVSFGPDDRVGPAVDALRRRTEAALFLRFPSLAREVDGALFLPEYLVDSVGWRSPSETEVFMRSSAQALPPRQLSKPPPTPAPLQAAMPMTPAPISQVRPLPLPPPPRGPIRASRHQTPLPVALAGEPRRLPEVESPRDLEEDELIEIDPRDIQELLSELKEAE